MGLPPIRLHDLRHSYATAALTAGVPVKVVSDRLGHANVGITSDLYMHVPDEMDGSAADRVADTILAPAEARSLILMTRQLRRRRSAGP